MRGFVQSSNLERRLADFEGTNVEKMAAAEKKTVVYPSRLQQRIFRMFRKCFKLAFEAFMKEKGVIFNRVAKDMSQDAFNEYLIEFLDFYYPSLLEKLEEDVLEKVMETMSLFILKDRHKKNYKITEGLDFEAWNNLVNRPKSEKFIEFFSLPENSFIY